MLPLQFEDSIPPEYEKFHFMIRGWTPRRRESKSKFNIFMEEISGGLPLKTEEVVIPDEEVAFVRLESTRSSTPLKKSIKRLCWCITNPGKRYYIDSVTTRSLLGISPASDHTLICWVEAIFTTALDNGPHYLNNIEVKEEGHIPDWAIFLSFAVIAGINIAGYQMTQSRDERNASTRKEVINNKMVTLFGSSGVSAGGNFLRKVTLENEDTPELRNSDRKIMDEIEEKIKETFDQIKDIRAATRRNKKDLSICCVKAVKTCYNATFLAARAMLADGDILQAYLTARMKETESIGITQGIAAVAFLTNAAMACEVVAAPWSFAAVGAWLSTGAWPTVLTVASPAGLAVGAVGLAILGISMFRNSQRKDEILHHQNLSILISRSCNVINEANTLRLCIYYLDSHESAGAADRYLERVGNEDFLQLWRAFIKEDKEKRDKRRRERGGVRASTTGSNQNNDQSSAQRQVSRYMKELTVAQESKLRACLKRLRKKGELDPSTPEGSSEEGSDMVSGDD